MTRLLIICAIIILVFLIGCSDTVEIEKEIVKSPAAQDEFSWQTISGQLDGSVKVNVNEFSFDRRMKLLQGNTDIISTMVGTYYSCYNKYPESWDQLKTSPIGKNIVLINPWTGNQLGYSEEFSPGEIKTFGLTTGGDFEFDFSYHNWESPDDYGGGSSHKSESFVNWETNTFGGDKPYRMPETEKEWEVFFNGYMLTTFASRFLGGVTLSGSLDGSDFCFFEADYKMILFSIRESDNSASYISLAEDELPNSLSVKVDEKFKIATISALGEDGTPVYQVSLKRPPAGFRPK